MNNLELIINGYPPIAISTDKRIEYYSSLGKANTINKYDYIIKLFVEEVLKSLDVI